MELDQGGQARVIAWIWARTVRCPNPACGAVIPLVSTWWLSKKKERPTWLQPIVSGSTVTFEVRVDPSGPSDPPKVGRGAMFRCLVCGDATTDAYVKAEAIAGRLGARLLAMAAEGNRQRIYLPPTSEQEVAAQVPRSLDAPDALMPDNPRWFSPPAFGLTTFGDLFTNRQLLLLGTLSDLVSEIRDQVQRDARLAEWSDSEAREYADSLALYLACIVDRLANENSSICSWDSNGTKQHVRATFARQALAMTWDYAEADPFGTSTGSVSESVRRVAEVVDRLPGAPPGASSQANAEVSPHGQVVATDPPYYDNIGYADLSDYFYVWLRRSLGAVHSDVTATMLTPKAEELVATPYRFGGSKARAEEHFERGFVRTFTRIRETQPADFPITLFYAFKQSEEDEAGTASTGWETMLNGLIEAGLAVTATWPMRTERSGRTIGIGSNALASSIVLACRARSSSAEAVTRRAFIAALKAELPSALRELQQGSVAPVDLAQAAIGPGMAVFSRYAKVVEADGADMTVRTALALINQVLDEVLSEQEGDFDADTRFCVKWFTQFGWNDATAGEADVLARATNTSVAGLVRGGVFKAVAGKARLLGPDDLAHDWDPVSDERVSDWEVAVRLAKSLDENDLSILRR